jgi:hypothetical protein
MSRAILGACVLAACAAADNPPGAVRPDAPTGGQNAGGAGPTGGSGPADAAPIRRADAGVGGVAGSDDPWPGSAPVLPVDEADELGMNLSGLAYLPARGGAPVTLLGVQNSPARLYRLVEQGGVWTRAPADGWAKGKTLRYADGHGEPDAEGVTTAESLDVAYVASEDVAGDLNRLSVLRYDLSGPTATLNATHEWNLTADLPPVDTNLGLEGITWIGDDQLVAAGFLDESTGLPYQPVRYPGHGSGLFLVGLEANGMIYAYALDHGSGASHRIATIVSGQEGVMELAYDRDLATLWAVCDEACDDRISLLAIDAIAGSPTRGRFVVGRGLGGPADLPRGNNEGITFAPVAECTAGQRRFFWADDAATDGHAVRAGSIPCGPLF